MKSALLLMGMLIAVVLVSGCTIPGNNQNTTTTIGQCRNGSEDCNNTAQCCAGLYCSGKLGTVCGTNSCGDHICQTAIEDTYLCPEDCSPKTTLMAFSCNQTNSTVSVTYTSKNTNNQSFYERPTYELWTDYSLNATCDPQKGAGCMVYSTGAANYYNLSIGATKTNVVSGIDLIQPNSRYIYYGIVPPRYWVKLCIAAYNPDGGSIYGSSLSCTFLSNADCNK